MQYLDELRVALEDAAATTDEPRAQLVRLVEAFVDYGLAHPAFVDCAQAIMRRPGGDLLEEVSESAMYRLGQAISGCLSVLTRTIEAGAESGDFHVDDPGLLANMLYASGLGTLQLGRVAMLVSEEAPGVPRISRVTAEQVRDHMVATALAVAAGPARLRARRGSAREVLGAREAEERRRPRCRARSPSAAPGRRAAPAPSAAPGRARRTSSASWVIAA